MAEQVKIGVVGTSWYADLVILPVFAGCERAKLSAICGRNRERADEMAAKFAIPQVFIDYRQMFDQAGLDAVIVATPDDTHYEIVMAALDAGLHVVCEKPVAMNARDAKAMYDKAEAAHLKHMVMLTWHWFPPLPRMKQLVDEGYLGKVYHGHFSWLMGYARGSEYSWRFDADRANGALGDVGSHMIHTARNLLGDVASVSAQLGFHVQREGIVHPANDSARLALEFTSGAQMDLQVSSVANTVEPEPERIFALYGDKGTLYGNAAFDGEFRARLSGAHDGSDEKLDEVSSLDLGTQLQNEAVGIPYFVNAILDDKPVYPGLYEGYKVQQVIDAALQSHETGCRVAITP